MFGLGAALVEFTKMEDLREGSQGKRVGMAVQRLQEQLDELRVSLTSEAGERPTEEVDDATIDRLVREVVRSRRRRESHFQGELFGEPAWDILLELYAAEQSHQKLSVSSVCVASAVPPTTALRWVEKMEREGWLRREADPHDARRSWVFLTEQASTAMRTYLQGLGVRPA